LQDPTSLRVGCGLTTLAQLNAGLAALEFRVAAAISGPPNGSAPANTTAADAAVAQARQDLATLSGRVGLAASAVVSLNNTLQDLKANAATDIAALKASLQRQTASTAADAAALKASLQQLGANVTAGLAALKAGIQPVNASDFLRVDAVIDAATLGGVPPGGYVTSPTQIVLYALPSPTDGNLGGRAGADALCQAAATRPAGYVSARAFISVSAADEIRDMPTLYGVPTNLPVVSLGTSPKTTLANNWADLLDGSIAASLQAAGVTLQGYVWTGSDRYGGTISDSFGNCNHWTTANDVSEAPPAPIRYAGTIGSTSQVNSGWLSVGLFGNFACENLNALTCLAF
jgi:hypothetical protein